MIGFRKRIPIHKKTAPQARHGEHGDSKIGQQTAPVPVLRHELTHFKLREMGVHSGKRQEKRATEKRDSGDASGQILGDDQTSRRTGARK